ncbi:MAG: PKD domain-containing protein [Candidatus Aenigmarchaeota archaeon]|nr:PKD domain-containing protein [Candidatus Aenigmarchaeota archaeon]
MKGVALNFRMILFIVFIVLLALSSAGNSTDNLTPSIESVWITPESPTKYNDLTCSVEVSDQDGNLNYVQFTWFVNGQMKRQVNKLVYGSFDRAEDVLSSWFTEAGDVVECEAKVYDFEHAYDFETHAVHVGHLPANSVPAVTYVEITPRHPNPQQDLTCSVLATDTDDNLDNIVFIWYRNGYVIRTSTKKIYGSSDTSSDVLDSSYTHSGDWIKCKVMVYDTMSALATCESLPVMISEYIPFFPPYHGNLMPHAVVSADDTDVSVGEYIRFSGEKSYDPDGYIVQYIFDFGDGSKSAWLPSNTPYIYHAYSTPGTYYVRVKVRDSYGVESYWSSPIAVHASSGEHYGGCGVLFTTFDYSSYVPENKTAWVEAEIKNTGRSGTFTMKFYVDDNLKDTYTRYLYSGQKVKKRFEFSGRTGSHKVKILVHMPCGGYKEKRASINFYSLDSKVFIKKEKEKRIEVAEVDVHIEPKSFDTKKNSGRVLTLVLESPELRTFELSVKGLPENWITYPEKVDVKGRETTYIYVVPKEAGSYQFTIVIKAGDRVFEKKINMYVALPLPHTETYMPFSGMITFMEKNPYVSIGIVLIIFALIIFAAHDRFEKEKYDEYRRVTPYSG